MARAPQSLRLPAIGQEVKVGYTRPLEDRVKDNGDGTYTHVLEFAWPRLVRDEDPR